MGENAICGFLGTEEEAKHVLFRTGHEIVFSFSVLLYMFNLHLDMYVTNDLYT